MSATDPAQPQPANPAGQRLPQVQASQGTTRFAQATFALAAREWVRFFKQKHRIMGALATPLLFWVLFGSGFGDTMQVPGQPAGMSYLVYFFPGMVMMVVLFTAIFASVSLIEDRNTGFLQGVMVAPVPRAAIVLGKVLGGAGIGAVQGVLLLVLAPLLGLAYGPLALIGAALMIVLISVALSGLGFLLAWRMDSVQGFHVIMNLVLIPMWLVSGAFFPAAGAHTWMQWLMALNPLTYALAGMRRMLQGAEAVATLGGPALGVSVVVLALFALAMVLASAYWAGRPAKA